MSGGRAGGARASTPTTGYTCHQGTTRPTPLSVYRRFSRFALPTPGHDFAKASSMHADFRWIVLASAHLAASWSVLWHRCLGRATRGSRRILSQSKRPAPPLPTPAGAELSWPRPPQRLCFNASPPSARRTLTRARPARGGPSERASRTSPTRRPRSTRRWGCMRTRAIRARRAWRAHRRSPALPRDGRRPPPSSSARVWRAWASALSAGRG